MAASKPTSRLLRNFHILSHLITILGPYLVVWAVSLSTMGLIPHRLTPGDGLPALVVWLGSVSSRPLTHPVPYLRHPYPKAAPKGISGRTSYLRARLAFHLYPQLIPSFCPSYGFGLPVRVIGPSPWPGVARPVSGLLKATYRPIRTRFPYGSRSPLP